MSDELKQQLEAIAQFVKTFGVPDDLIKQKGGPFFHYTDYDGFAGIVTKKDLWLTDARCSNDGQEIEHGRKLVQERIKILAKDGRSDKLKSFADKVANALRAEEKKVDVGRQRSASDAAYICCFCGGQGDLLSQWRGYGSGVAIEIAPNCFHPIAGVSNRAGVMRFWPVYYEDETKSSKIEDILEFWANGSASVENAVATLKFFVPTFKHKSFEQENEWRLIFTPHPSCEIKPKFRTSRGLLVPYFELAGLASLPADGSAAPISSTAALKIDSVRIGPGRYQDVNARSARVLLDSHDFKNPPRASF